MTTALQESSSGVSVAAACVDAAQQQPVVKEQAKTAHPVRGRSYVRCCCCTLTSAAAVTAAVAGVVFYKYGGEQIMAECSKLWTNHTI